LPKENHLRVIHMLALPFQALTRDQGAWGNSTFVAYTDLIRSVFHELTNQARYLLYNLYNFRHSKILSHHSR
jgi:hypothetical protein